MTDMESDGVMIYVSDTMRLIEAEQNSEFINERGERFEALTVDKMADIYRRVKIFQRKQPRRYEQAERKLQAVEAAAFKLYGAEKVWPVCRAALESIDGLPTFELYHRDTLRGRIARMPEAQARRWASEADRLQAQGMDEQEAARVAFTRLTQQAMEGGR